ncbi:MAG: hypothetical protein IPL46_00375 [Saprospiraceae bacterium]|nr:hypothetical protein [Saprospiraceae bacterium]
MPRKPLEILLAQLIGYIAVFLWDEHVAYLLSLIIAVIVLAVLIISYLVEKIEPSKVPASYFKLMWILFAAPVIALIFLPHSGCCNDLGG